MTEMPAMREVRGQVEAERFVPGTGVGTAAADPVGVMSAKILKYRARTSRTRSRACGPRSTSSRSN